MDAVPTEPLQCPSSDPRHKRIHHATRLPAVALKTCFYLENSETFEFPNIVQISYPLFRMLGARGVSDSLGVLICFLPQFWNICIYITRYLRVAFEYKQEIQFCYIYTLYTQKVISYIFLCFWWGQTCRRIAQNSVLNEQGYPVNRQRLWLLLSSVVAHAYNPSIQEAEVELQ